MLSNIAIIVIILIQGYWTSTMSKQYTEYKSLDAAQRNLIKLVFFQDVLTMTTETQTASYEIQNFIGTCNFL